MSILALFKVLRFISDLHLTEVYLEQVQIYSVSFALVCWHPSHGLFQHESSRLSLIIKVNYETKVKEKSYNFDNKLHRNRIYRCICIHLN